MKKQSKDIFIVDDLTQNIQVLGNILMKKGFSIHIAKSGEQAISSIKNVQPDLILLDISMPEMDGYEVCTYLKSCEETKHIPVIFLTARTEEEDIIKAFNTGGVDYISKPYRSTELISRIKTHIELKDVHEELKQINASKDKLFRIIGHDLRSPISQVIQMSELLESHYGDIPEKEMKEMFLHVRNSSLRSLKLLENLFSWACSQTGSMVFNPQKCQISEVINENVKLFEEQAEIKNIRIIASNLYEEEIVADKDMINTIVRNFLSNAIKFSYPKGTIDIQNEVRRNNLIVMVTDDGTGMSPEDCDKLFKIGEGCSKFGTNNEKGTGIGLLLCKEFVDKHSGSIWVESKLGEGSRFSFSIPIKPGESHCDCESHFNKAF